VIRLNKVAGIALVALPVLSIVGFAGAGPIAEIDPFARGEVEGLLRAIWRVGIAIVAVATALDVRADLTGPLRGVTKRWAAERTLRQPLTSLASASVAR